MVSVAVVAGDGIGCEVVPVAIQCVDAALVGHGPKIEWAEYPWGSDLYRATGRMMPVDGILQLARHDAIFLGAVGMPDIPDTETLWGLLIPIRREFDQYVNLRPVKALRGVPSPVAGGDAIDLVIVRENTEGEYSEIGGRAFRQQTRESAIQVDVFTRHGIERIAQFAAEMAASRRGELISATKSNGIVHTMPFWDEVVSAVAAVTARESPRLRLESVLIDALAARMVLSPASIDVVVASNLFGDILSDLAGAVAGSIGVAPSANLNPERRHPSLFEPVHGSAPDIAGLNVANPLGQIWTGVMMLEHLGFTEAATALRRAFEEVTADGTRTRDLGGVASTTEVGDAVVAVLKGREL